MFNLVELQIILKKYNQEHLLNFWNELDEGKQQILINDINHINFKEIFTRFEETISKTKINGCKNELLEPLCDQVFYSISNLSNKEIENLRNIGLNAIIDGKLAVILLCGGQGTRLGVSYPKGMYDVDLPSKKSLFQLQAERLQKLQKIASNKKGKKVSIPWYIMTSDSTKDITENYFKKKNYFNLDANNLIFFEQNKLPCFSLDGKILLKSKYEICFSPDGNGGLYKALKTNFIFEDIKKRNIEYVHVYCVDNILVKIADPVFIGHCISKNVEAGAKSVKKNYPHEPVGVFSKLNNKFKVVEYSEISKELAELKDKNGNAVYNCGNICNHFFKISFLQKIKDYKLPYHIAKKKIKFMELHGKLKEPLLPNGIKLEKFIFDVFEFTKEFTVFEVIRSHEFAPLKNNDLAKEDTAAMSKLAIFKLHREYIQNAGAKFENSDQECICEISPLLSYAGEDLSHLVNEKRLRFPLILYAEEEKKHNIINTII